MHYRRLIAKKTIRPAIFILLIVTGCLGCLSEPSNKTLTFEEEEQLQKQEEYTHSLPQGQQGIGKRQVECNREVLEDAGDKTRCESFEKALQPDEAPDRSKSIDATIDRNLKGAVDNSGK